MGISKAKGNGTRSPSVSKEKPTVVKVDKKDTPSNITKEVVEAYPFHTGCIYKKKDSGGLYYINGFSQHFDKDNWFVVFSNPANRKLFILEAENFKHQFELLPMTSKDK